MFGKFPAVYQDWLDFTNTLNQIKMPLNKKSQSELMDRLQGICEAFTTGRFWEEDPLISLDSQGDPWSPEGEEAVAKGKGLAHGIRHKLVAGKKVPLTQKWKLQMGKY